MNRRLLVFALVAVAALGIGAFLTLGPSSRPAPADRVSAPAATPAPPAPPPASPAPESKAPVEPRRADPRPRAAAPRAPAPAAPEPAAAGADAAMLSVDVDVPEAQVFVDRVFIGKAPVTTTDVKPGSHRLNVSATGYEGVAQTIDVKPGTQQVTVKLREVRLDASLDVVHKHRMGSCTGKLVATPRGLRYDTSDKDDAFRSGLVDLDVFEVDYLKKNLRIRPKGGKSYDFTDPEGNADHLFVFHRDVDKARERLRKGDPPAE